MTLTAHPPVTGPAPMLDSAGRPAMERWSLRRDVVHLNHGSFGAVPIATAEHQAALVDEMNAAPGAWFASLPERVAAARVSVAGFLGVEPDRLTMVPNASAGVTVVLASLRLEPGAEIVITDHAYGAVRMAAERAVSRAGGRVVVVPVPLDASDDDVVAAIGSAVTDRTALLIVDQIASATTRVFPVSAIAGAARSLGIRLLVDAAHAPAMVADPLAGGAGDFWVGNLHKWACAPRGSAALVAGADVAQSLHPPIDSWGAPLAYPERFDHQGTIDVTSYLAAPHAIAHVESEFGWDAAREYQASLADAGEQLIADALEAATGTPARTALASPAPAMRLLALPRELVGEPTELHAVHQALAAAGFQTAITGFGGAPYLRISAHVYNTVADYAAFADRAVPLLADLAARRRADPALPLDAIRT